MAWEQEVALITGTGRGEMEMNYGRTKIVVCEDEKDLGRKSAAAVAETLRELLTRQEEVRMILAAGESQATFLEALALEPGIWWSQVVCFNMDDFWDVSIPERFTCGYQTRTQLYDKVLPKRFHLVRFNAPDPYAEARHFESLLRAAAPMDVLCQGIGTSGHLALNEPYQADFKDLDWVRVVDIAKRDILTRLLATPTPTEELPASILSEFEGTLYADRNSWPHDVLFD
jgi:Glucosamine-6-phosphate isomerases/6-phosphogluconolactonase